MQALRLSLANCSAELVSGQPVANTPGGEQRCSIARILVTPNEFLQISGLSAHGPEAQDMYAAVLIRRCLSSGGVWAGWGFNGARASVLANFVRRALVLVVESYDHCLVGAVHIMIQCPVL